MKKTIYEKIVSSATFQELWKSRLPDFRARSELRNLNRQGISSTYKKHDDNLFRVTAEATTEKHIAYLEKRDYAPTVLCGRPKKRKAKVRDYPDVVRTILAPPRTGAGCGIPLTRGEVAMLFMDGYAGDGPGLLDIRSQGYGDDNDWDGLTYDDVLDNTDEMPGEAAFVWTKWEPLELWPDK
jgi:hypothetical protein